MFPLDEVVSQRDRILFDAYIFGKAPQTPRLATYLMCPNCKTEYVFIMEKKGDLVKAVCQNCFCMFESIDVSNPFIEAA